jgi:hypothetical protein
MRSVPRPMPRAFCTKTPYADGIYENPNDGAPIDITRQLSNSGIIPFDFRTPAFRASPSYSTNLRSNGRRRK